MRRLLDLAEEKISQLLREARDHAVKSLELSIEVYKNSPKSGEILALASRLHDIHHEVTELVMEAVARFNPVASDLRFLRGALFVSYDLYRVARYAYDVAIVVEKLGGGCVSQKVEEVGGLVSKMVATAVDMFLTRDISHIEELDKLDDVVDRAYGDALRDVLKGPDRCGVIETMALRLFERASDHAVYIGNHTYYLATGLLRR
ncbi:MAG: phosphate signaling complex PhoU family protein [Pyrobaculum sp.]